MQAIAERIEDLVGLCASLRRMVGAAGPRGGSGARFVIACVCKDPLHDMWVCKRPYSQQFATHTPRFVGSGSKRPSTALRVPLQILMREPGLRYGFLPDLGMFIRAIIQKRFFTPSIMKHAHRAKQSVNPWHRLPVPRPSNTWMLLDSACACILHESIPCLKRVKRSQKGLSLKGCYSKEDLSACIAVLYGSTMKLYPLGYKAPTFRSRVVMMDRISSVMQAGVDGMVRFINENMDLVRLCFMEYVVNIISFDMPCERELLLSHNAMESFEPTCITMCDTFRQESIGTGHEPWGALNGSARLCIERCIRICKFKMLRVADVCLKGCINPSSFRKESLLMR